MEQTYNEFIQNIINTRGQWNIPEGEYFEKHHIIPRCKGGSNGKENIIYLYAREHFIAHKILFEENKNDKALSQAFMMMSRIDSITESEYEYARKAGPWNKGLTKETDERVKNNGVATSRGSIGKKVKPFTEEHKNNISKATKGISKNAGVSNPMYGKNAYENKTKEELEEINKKKSESQSKYYSTHIVKWYTNGIINTHSEVCPDGWWEGMTISNESKLARGEYSRGTHWYNNGIISKQYKENEVPDGWVRGRLLNSIKKG